MAKTTAQRQAEYRARRRQQGDIVRLNTEVSLIAHNCARTARSLSRPDPVPDADAGYRRRGTGAIGDPAC